MRCFNHPEKEAVGSCKMCSKGLCPECAADLGHGLACRNRHETEVESIHALIGRNIQMANAAPKAGYVGPVFNLFLGAVFLIYGLFSPEEGISFLSVMGVGFCVFGIILLGVNRRAFQSWGK